MIIGLGYKARVGKDTVGDYLNQEMGFGKASFAFAIKEAVKIIYGWNDRHVYGDLKEIVDPFWGESPRRVMQIFGTEACRNHLDDDIWIKSVLRKIQNVNENWVVTDVRYPNEVAAIKNLGGVLVRIDRRFPDETSSGANRHISETALDGFTGWDYSLQNNDSFTSLYRKVDELLSNIMGDEGE